MSLRHFSAYQVTLQYYKLCAVLGFGPFKEASTWPQDILILPDPEESLQP